MRMLIVALVLACVSLGPAHAQNFTDIKPSPQQLAWQDLEFGVLIHFGTNTFLDREWGDGTADPKVFAPSQLDVNQWMRAIKASGAKYVVLVAKHHDGFCLWPTNETEYSVKSSPWENGQGDLVRPVSDASQTLGLKFGLYLSPWDRHEPRYKNSSQYDQCWRPVEADTPLHKNLWFWHPNEEATLKSVGELISTYEQTVGRGGQLMLGLAPDRRGLLPDADVKRLEEFGVALRKRYTENLVAKEHLKADNTSAALDGDPATFWSAPAGSHHAVLETEFAKPVRFDHTLVME